MIIKYIDIRLRNGILPCTWDIQKLKNHNLILLSYQNYQRRYIASKKIDFESVCISSYIKQSRITLYIILRIRNPFEKAYLNTAQHQSTHSTYIGKVIQLRMFCLYLIIIFARILYRKKKMFRKVMNDLGLNGIHTHITRISLVLCRPCWLYASIGENFVIYGQSAGRVFSLCCRSYSTCT